MRPNRSRTRFVIPTPPSPLEIMTTLPLTRAAFRLGSLRIAALAVVMATCAACRGREPQDRNAELLALNAEYDRALVDADSVALDSLYHADFTYLGPGGEMRTRAAQIAALTSGRVDVIEGQSDSVIVRAYGPAAVLVGQFRGRAAVGADAFAFHERYSTTWLLESGRWWLVLEHGTVMRQSAGP